MLGKASELKTAIVTNNSKPFEAALSNFLKEVGEIDVLDIKYAHSVDIRGKNCQSALIIYKEAQSYEQ